MSSLKESLSFFGKKTFVLLSLPAHLPPFYGFLRLQITNWKEGKKVIHREEQVINL